MNGTSGCDANADTEFDAWYATQRHILSNEDLCRLIWRKGYGRGAEASEDKLAMRAKRRIAHELTGAVCHADWHNALEFHMTRHAAMCDLRAAIFSPIINQRGIDR